MSTRSLALLCLMFTLSACSFWTTPAQTDSASSSSASSETNYVPTPNVTYQGVIRSAAPSIVMEGTHTLELTKGGIVYLSTTDQGMDLDRYIDAEVEVRGSVRPTTEGNAIHMFVNEVTVLSALSSSVSSESSDTRMCGGIAGIACGAGEECIDDTTDSCDPNNGGADCSGICVPASSSSSVSSVASSSTVISSSISSSASAVASSVSSSVASTANEEMIVLMSKQDYAASLWTQQYCTSHIAFCIPAHKNWYYKSFGATTSNLWHLEFSMEPIETLGAGPIVLNLLQSSLEAAGATDGAIQTHGATIIGFKAWTDGTHFEIIADARLRTAVSYMLSQIVPYTPAE